MPDDAAPASLALRLARWFDARLADCPPPPSSMVLLYGLEVIDADLIDDLGPTAVRTVFVGEGPDAETILALPTTRRLVAHDAIARVEYRWLPKEGTLARPGSFSQRRRARVLRVDADTSATAIRFDDGPDGVFFSSAA